MTELISIIVQFLIFISIFSFPLSPKTVKTIFNNEVYNFGIFDTFMINGIIIFNILLLLSFLNFDLEIIFYSFLITFIFFFVFEF